MPPYEDDPAATRMQLSIPRMTPVVRLLLIVNAAAFAVQVLVYLTDTGPGSPRLSDAISWLGLAPDRWSGSFPLVPVWQLLTYGVLHSVGEPTHILYNMLMLYFFGTMLEERLGRRRFLLTYVSAQVVGGLCFLAPLLFGVHTHAPAIGASGAVFGVMVALATLYPRQTVYMIIVPIQLKWMAIFFVGLEAYLALISFMAGSDGVAHLVHLGGAAYGFLAVRTGLIEKDPVEILERRRAVAQVERAADDEARMDRLLDKIHKDGMGSLTRAEKDFLKRMSSKR
jgi:membrane associated rhomboid family serine protease